MTYISMLSKVWPSCRKTFSSPAASAESVPKKERNSHPNGFEHAVSDNIIIIYIYWNIILIISERARLEMTYISMSPKIICEGAKRPSGGRVSPLPGQGNFWYFEPEKQFLMHILAKITRIRFPLNTIGQDDNIELWACRFRYIHLNNN